MPNPFDPDKLIEQTSLSKSVVQIMADYEHVYNRLTSIGAPTQIEMMDVTLSIICDAYNKEIADKPHPRQHRTNLPPARGR